MLQNSSLRKIFRPWLKLLSITLFLTVSIFSTKAQVKTKEQKLDSLLIVNQQHPKEDSMKLVVLRQVYRQYFKLKDDINAERYVNSSITLAKKLKQGDYVAMAYYNLGLYYHGFANYHKAEDNYLKAVEAYSNVNNLDMEAGTYLNLGALYIGIPDYAKALQANQKAIPIYLKMDNRADLASAYVNVAQIYQSLNQHFEAVSYGKKAEKLFLEFGKENRGLASVYGMMGSSYLNATDEELSQLGVEKQQRYNKALEILNRGLKIALSINDPSTVGPIYQELAIIYETTGKKDLALKAYQNAIKYTDIEDNKSSYASSLIALANFYSNASNYQKANELLSQALKIGQDAKLFEIQRNSYQKLSENEEKAGNFNQSLQYYRQYISFKDQIFNQEKEREITRRQMELNFTVKENDYQLKQRITDGELQRQVLLAKQQQQQLILRRQQLLLSDKERELQRITFLQAKADLETKQLFQASLLKQEQLKAALDKQFRDRKISLQQSELSFNKKINIVLSLVAVMLLGAGSYVYYAQRKTARLNKIVSAQKQELEQLGHVKDRIFSVVSHDMRTPVNSLISFIQILEDGNIEPEKLKKYASQLKNTLGYTSSMMENLLNWASSQMQGFKPAMEKFDLQDCALEVINSMSAQATLKKINITNHIKPGSFCFADMNMTSLILRNLISNAIKFTATHGNIELNANEEQGKVSISIADNGVGLSATNLTAINSIGYQENGSSTLGTNQEKGTGIGLLLCKTFTKLMDGRLNASTEINNGSKFTLTLPKG